MPRKKDYTAKDIKVLEPREHVRLRTQVYLGNMEPTMYMVPLFIGNKFEAKAVEFIPAVYKAVGEVVDNALDEFAQIDIKNKHITISAHPILGMYTISDNGRGVPVGKHETGPNTPEVVFNQLMSGRNFEEEKEAGVIGQNGVGSACVNFCSTEFKVDIHNNGKRYRQTFSNGGTKVSRASIRKNGQRTGTKVEFQLDPAVFKDITLPEELMENRAIEIALTNPGVTAEYNGKKYKYRKGFEEMIKKFSTEYFKFQNGDFEFYVIFDAIQGNKEQIYTWVNSSLLFDGGICNTQFLNAFSDKAIDHLASAAKKRKCKVSREDVLNSLLVIGNLRVSDPRYDSQAKTRMTGPGMRGKIDAVIKEQWNSFSRRNKAWLERVLDLAESHFHSKEDKKAVDEHKKKLSKKIPTLMDANSKNRRECSLLVTEGLSAAAMITDARDPETQASYPLTGKFNNVWGATVAQLLKMGKLQELISAIGLVPGKRAMRSELNFGKVIIATDADVDGGDIFTLAVNLFYGFWPELLDPEYPPFIYRLIAPNVCAVKGKKRVHFRTLKEYEKVKGRYKGYSISYYKGLGSMEPEDWEMILSGQTDTLIPIQDDGNMKTTLELLFGPDPDARKEWLQS